MESSDQVYVWGSDSWGQLGIGGMQKRNYTLPQMCSYGVRVVQVACGEEHALLLTPEGALYAFGSNADGRLGINDRATPLRSLPTLIPDLVSTPLVSIACGAAHSAAVTVSGDLYTWGQGRHGALGTGGSLNHYSPQQVSFPSGYTVHAVFCGGRHTSALVKDPSNDKKAVYMCGAGEVGQLGLGRKDNELVPKRLTLDSEIDYAALGYAHTLFLSSTGTVYSTGSNTTGQLGTGNRKSLKRPVVVPGLSNVVNIAAGTQSAAVTREGQLYLWGSGVFGEYLSPQRVKTAVEAQWVSLGSGFGAVLDMHGHVWTWGNNAGGELGHGDTDLRLTPFPVMSLKDKTVKIVTCGAGFSIAVGETTRKARGDSVSTERAVRSKSSHAEDGMRAPAKEPDHRRIDLLQREAEEWRHRASEAQNALDKVQRDFASRSHSTISELERLSRSVSQTNSMETRLKELEQTLKNTQIELFESQNKANLAVLEGNRRNERLEMELKRTQKEVNRLENELISAMRAKSDLQKQLERNSVSSEVVLQQLSSRLNDLEGSYVLHSHSDTVYLGIENDTSKIASLELEIAELRTILQKNSGGKEILEAEVEGMRAKIDTLERENDKKEARIRELSNALEKQESRNRSLLQALEREVKPGSMNRTKALSSDSALDRTLPSSHLARPSFHQNKSLLEARMDALELKLTTLQRSQPLF